MTSHAQARLGLDKRGRDAPAGRQAGEALGLGGRGQASGRSRYVSVSVCLGDAGAWTFFRRQVASTGARVPPSSRRRVSHTVAWRAGVVVGAHVAPELRAVCLAQLLCLTSRCYPEAEFTGIDCPRVCWSRTFAFACRGALTPSRPRRCASDFPLCRGVIFSVRRHHTWSGGRRCGRVIARASCQMRA